MLAADFDRKTGRAWRPWRTLLCVPSRLLHGRITRHRALEKSILRDTEAAELLEFALVLPLLIVMVVGLLDFAHGYNLKQKLTNAARAGARLGAATPTLGDTGTCTGYTAPCSVVGIYNNVVSYLTDAGIDTTSLATSPGSCTNSSGGTVAYCWEYTATGNAGLQTLMIERGVLISAAGMPDLTGTRVTITYNYDWTFGFNHVIDLLVPSAQVSSSVLLTADALMANQ